jgi:hypothetical protein
VFKFKGWLKVILAQTIRGRPGFIVTPRFSVNDLKGRVITLQERWQLGCGLEFAYD